MVVSGNQRLVCGSSLDSPKLAPIPSSYSRFIYTPTVYTHSECSHPPQNNCECGHVDSLLPLTRWRVGHHSQSAYPLIINLCIVTNFQLACYFTRYRPHLLFGSSRYIMFKSDILIRQSV